MCGQHCAGPRCAMPFSLPHSLPHSLLPSPLPRLCSRRCPPCLLSVSDPAPAASRLARERDVLLERAVRAGRPLRHHARQRLSAPRPVEPAVSHARDVLRPLLLESRAAGASAARRGRVEGRASQLLVDPAGRDQDDLCARHRLLQRAEDGGHVLLELLLRHAARGGGDVVVRAEAHRDGKDVLPRGGADYSAELATARGYPRLPEIARDCTCRLIEPRISLSDARSSL